MLGGLEGLKTIFDTSSRRNFNRWIGSLVPLRQTWKNSNVKRRNAGHLVDIRCIRGRTLAFMFASLVLDNIRKMHGTEPNFQNKFNKKIVPSSQLMTDMVIPFHLKKTQTKRFHHANYRGLWDRFFCGCQIGSSECITCIREYLTIPLNTWLETNMKWFFKLFVLPRWVVAETFAFPTTT